MGCCFVIARAADDAGFHERGRCGGSGHVGRENTAQSAAGKVAEGVGCERFGTHRWPEDFVMPISEFCPFPGALAILRPHSAPLPGSGEPRTTPINSLIINELRPKRNSSRFKRNFVCSGRNVVCSGRNFVCSGRNFVCSGRNFVCSERNFVCSGRNSFCRGRNLVCSESHAVCAERNSFCCGRRAGCSGRNSFCLGRNAVCAGCRRTAGKRDENFEVDKSSSHLVKKCGPLKKKKLT